MSCLVSSMDMPKVVVVVVLFFFQFLIWITIQKVLATVQNLITKI